MTEQDIKNVFNLSPDLEDFVNFSQFSAEFEAPGKERTHKIRISLMWEGELSDLIIRSGRVVTPTDNMGRSVYIKLEKLVQSINSIDGELFDTEESKGKLRMILEKSSPALITYISEMLDILMEQRNNYVQSKTEELKKKFREQVLNLKPL